MIFKKDNTVPNIWTSQENLVHFHRLLSLGLGVLAVLLLALITALCFRNPIVVVRNGSAQEFYQGTSAKVTFEKADVEDFTRKFISALYAWSEFNGDALSKEIGPLAEAGLVTKVIDGHAQKFSKELKGKHLSQAIAFLRIEVLPDRVVCRFDRILKIEGIPLVIPMEVTLSMIQSSPTRLNPMGVYVAGITEQDGAK